MTNSQERAIAELAKIRPSHAEALSGNNPPGPRLPPRPYPFIRIGLYLLVIPFGCLVAAIYALMAFVASANAHARGGVGETGLLGAIVLVIIGICFFFFGTQLHSEPREQEPGPPIPMKLLERDFLCEAYDREIFLKLEYQIPASVKDPHFEHLIEGHYKRIVGEYTDAMMLNYLDVCATQKKKPKPDDFEAALDKDEIEARLVAPFGQAVFETGIKVFRFSVIKSVTIVAPKAPTVPRRGFIGTSP